MTTEVNIELVSNSDKWIKYKIRLVEMKGEVRDTQCIQVLTPQNESIIKPNGKHSAKVCKLKFNSPCIADNLFV